MRVLALATFTLAACVSPEAAPSASEPLPSSGEHAVAQESDSGLEEGSESSTNPAAEPPAEPAPGSGVEVVATTPPQPAGAAMLALPPADISPPFNPFAPDRIFIYRVDIGQRRFDSSAWEPVSDPFLVSTGLIYEPKYWALGMETGFSYSTDDGIVDGSGYESTNMELYGGLGRSLWLVSDKLLLSLFAGLSMNWTKERIKVSTGPFTTQSIDGRNSWLAGYVSARLGWKFSDTFDIGVDVRAASGQNVSVIGPVRSSDNFQVLIGIGIYQ